MKILLALIQLAFLAAFLAVIYWFGRLVNDAAPVPPLRPPVHSISAPTLEAIQKLSSLMVTRVAVADVSETRIDGYTGGLTAIVVIRGDFLLGVDLSAAKFVNFDEKERSVVMTLPPPAVSSPRLDQEKTRLLCLNHQGLWALIPGSTGQEVIVNHAYRHAQGIVAAAGSDPTLLKDARIHAESALGSFFAAIGWKVTIHWADR